MHERDSVWLNMKIGETKLLTSVSNVIDKIFEDVFQSFRWDDKSVDSHAGNIVKYVKICVCVCVCVCWKLHERKSIYSPAIIWYCKLHIVHEMSLGASSASSSLILRDSFKIPASLCILSFLSVVSSPLPTDSQLERSPEYQPNCNPVVGEAAALSPIS